MIVMFDTVTAQDIPSFANTSRDAVAGYVDGWYTNIHQVEAHDPHAHHLSIAVRSTDIADCLDIENGDATPAEAPGWWHLATMHGVWRPCLYASISNVPEVVRVLTHSGIHRSSYRLWAAHYTYHPHVEPGTDATQWTDKALFRNLDESLCLDTFFPNPHLAKKRAAPKVETALVELDPARGEWRISHRPDREGF